MTVVAIEPIDPPEVRLEVAAIAARA